MSPSGGATRPADGAPTRPGLSACVVTRNEEDRIGDCLDSLAWCDEIVVVDSRSEDRTREIAAARGARVIERDWPGHVEQKEFAVRQARHDWVLCVDADERVSPELGTEISDLRQAGFPDMAGWRMPRLSSYLGRWIRHGTWYPDLQLRLFDRRRGRWGGRDPHDRVELDGPAGRLRGNLLHHPYRSLEDHLATIDRYTTTMARELHRRGRRARLSDMALRPPWRFLRFYVLAGGWMNGWRGLLMAHLAAHYVRLKYAKLRILGREAGARRRPWWRRPRWWKKRIRRLRRPVETPLLSASVWLVNALPERTALALGALAGRCAARIDRKHARRALANLRTAFPEWSEARHREFLLENFAEMGRNAMEWARLLALSPEEIRERVDWRGADHLQRAIARGKGALVVTAHLGHWELIPPAAKLRFPEMEIAAVGRPIRNRTAQAAIDERRNLGGGNSLPRDARAILKALRRNAAVGVLVDQYISPQKGGILVPFLGRRAYTNPGPAILALRSGAAVLPVHARRTSGVRHCIELGPEIELPRTGNIRADAAEATARISVAIEVLVRAHPELWLWAHRRWHHSPDVDRDLYGKRRPRR